MSNVSTTISAIETSCVVTRELFKLSFFHFILIYSINVSRYIGDLRRELNVGRSLRKARSASVLVGKGNPDMNFRGVIKWS